jgi:ABC-type transporter Mla subunit MlaD
MLKLFDRPQLHAASRGVQHLQQQTESWLRAATETVANVQRVHDEMSELLSRITFTADSVNNVIISKQESIASALSSAGSVVAASYGITRNQSLPWLQRASVQVSPLPRRSANMNTYCINVHGQVSVHNSLLNQNLLAKSFMHTKNHW